MAEQDNINRSIPYLGMNLENDPSSFEDGEFSFVLNAVLQEGFGDSPHVSNAAATELATVLPEGQLLLNPGGTPVEHGKWLLFSVNPSSGECMIGYATKSTYRLIVSDAALGFSITAEIQAKVKRSYNGDYYAYWVAVGSPIRVMNLDHPPLLDGRLDIDQLKLFKNYDLPELEVTELMNVGQVTSGGYFFWMQYADGRGNGLTACHRLTGKIAIIRDSISDAYENITGCKSNLPTNKAVKLTLRGADPSFTHLNVGIVRLVDGAAAGYRVATIPVAQEEYIYTGAGTELPVPVAEIIQPAVVYDTAKTIEEADGSLVIGNLVGKRTLNLQPYVSRIQVQWQAYRTRPKHRQASHKNPLFAATMQSYRRDEVVPLALVAEFTDGTESEAYPLVGRALNQKSNGQPFTGDTDVFGNAINPLSWDSQVMPINDDVYENQSLPRWKVYNTATVEGDRGRVPGAEGLSYYGECAYWESTDRYPDNPKVWGELAGRPMRFPKMPDLAVLPLMDRERDDRRSGGIGGVIDALTAKPYLYHLGVVFPNIEEVMNSLPDEVRSQVKGWRIVRADRRFNKSIIASGLLFNCYEQDFRETVDGDPDLRVYPNYPFNDLRPDPYISAKYPDGNSTLVGGVLGVHVPNNRYRKDIFTFLSPDTTLQRAALSNVELKIEGEAAGEALCYHRWVEPFPKLREKGNENSRAALQGLGLGEYGQWLRPVYGNTRRRLKEAMYIPMDAYVSGGNAGRNVWNRGRESTVLLATEREVHNPRSADRSRFILTNEDQPLSTEVFTADPENANVSVKVKRPIAAHYVTIKQNLPNQYGGLSNLKWVETGYTRSKYLETGACFGGDTYIGQFADKRQMVFYNELQAWMDQADSGDGMDLKGNMLLPGTRYYYRNTGANPRNDSHMMLEDNSGWFGGDHKDLGFITLFMHGVPLFWVESDVNVDLRYEGDGEWEGVYPSLHDGATQVQQWLGVKHLDKDNAHYHNIDLSGYNDLRYIANGDPLLDPDNNDQVHYSTRAIKSLRSQPEDIYDNWQIFKPLDYYDFSKSRGVLWDIRYVGQGRTLFRFERALQYSALQQSLAASEGQILLGTGRLFAQDPQELLHTETGYGGTRSQWAFNITQFGAFFVDSESGKVFQFANGLQEISNNKAAGWFRENLPFKLSRDIPGLPVDNPANPNGVGLHSTFDPRHNLWILTKKDYEVVDKSARVEYREGRIYHNGGEVTLDDSDLFANRSWTLAYSPLTRRWFTFYSFIPDAYLNDAEIVVSVTSRGGTSKVHRHDSRSLLQTFYGRPAPFVLEYVNKLDGATNYISAHASFVARSFELENGNLVPVRDRSFNKAIVYNQSQCTGLLNLVIQDENNLFTLRRGLKVYPDSRDVALRLRGGQWNFSDYFDIARSDSYFTQNWNDPAYRQGYYIDKVLQGSALDYSYPWKQAALLRGLWSKTRLILDDTQTLKLLFQVGIEGARVSYP